MAVVPPLPSAHSLTVLIWWPGSKPSTTVLWMTLGAVGGADRSGGG
jgi:hypothetical protein